MVRRLLYFRNTARRLTDLFEKLTDLFCATAANGEYHWTAVDVASNTKVQNYCSTVGVRGAAFRLFYTTTSGH